MKKTVIILSALALFAAVSCQKAETPVEAPKGHPVTLTVGLTPETRISHALDGTTIKTAWESTDFVFVQFGNQTEIFSIDEIDGKTATFKNTNSNLTDTDPYTVTYASQAHMTYDATAADYGLSTFNLNSQNGKYANLPEYLVAEYDPEDPSALVLEPKLTYFHFVVISAMDNMHYPVLIRPYLESGMMLQMILQVPHLKSFRIAMFIRYNLLPAFLQHIRSTLTCMLPQR